ncbi:hypothetical protein [Streptomyces sp. NRRL S-337]|uniref:hypothetical protein n=1 Tax=Streptomyces sp. NRRL S-337 TaxID=1463900 RepID=UPI001F24C026|nr:hypothetical protein [Streptomyces sp. NRRL S-337]
MTADLLHQLDLQPGHRVLDIGTGAAMTAAIACWICGDGGVVTLDRDQHGSPQVPADTSSTAAKPHPPTNHAPSGSPSTICGRAWYGPG